MLVGLFLSNCLIALMVFARGYGFKYKMLTAMIPLPLSLLAFKFYCKHTFDHSMKYYTKGDLSKGAEAPTPIDKESRRHDRVAVRFGKSSSSPGAFSVSAKPPTLGHPALYQKLIVPMVREESKHLLSEIYRGRLDSDLGNTGFSDVYHMKQMSREHPGKGATTNTSPFEFVSESNMDFENFKNRPDFNDDHGGEGSLYGAPASTFDHPRPGSRDSDTTFASTSRNAPAGDDDGVSYPAGYHHTPLLHSHEYNADAEPELHKLDSSSSTVYHAPDGSGLLAGAAPMGRQGPGGYMPYSPRR